MIFNLFKIEKIFVFNSLTNNNRNSGIFQTRNEILEVTAFCSSAHEKKVISGTYIAKGVFGGHIIYEKTVADDFGNWWSLRYDKPSEDQWRPSTNQWIFMFNKQQVTIGESIFGSIIESYSNRPGKVKYYIFEHRNPRINLRTK